MRQFAVVTDILIGSCRPLELMLKGAEELMIGYKVVRRDDDDRLFSATSCGDLLEYSGVTVPLSGSGPLCVFESVLAARDFIGGSMCGEIWKCYYLSAVADRIWNKVGFLPVGVLPLGTRLAAAVKLIERCPDRCY